MRALRRSDGSSLTQLSGSTTSNGPLPPPAVRQEIRETDAQFVPTLLGPNGTSANFLEWGYELPQCQPVRASLKATIPVHGRWVIRFSPPEQAAERVVDI